MALEVRGEDKLDEEEAEAAQLCGVQVAQPEELGARAQQPPRARCVVVLQHRPVVVQDRLHQPTPHSYVPLSYSFYVVNFHQFLSKAAHLNIKYILVFVCTLVRVIGGVPAGVRWSRGTRCCGPGDRSRAARRPRTERAAQLAPNVRLRSPPDSPPPRTNNDSRLSSAGRQA